jgi:Formyl transferase
MDAIFCGNGSLLIQCAEGFRQVGGTISGIVTNDAQIIAWAGAEGLPHLGTAEAPDLGDIAFDYLFSVANLTVLPEALIARAGRMAINFHDGPLPGRAGLNVPVWAIIEGAETHAVTWHEMLAAVDAGRALKVRSFEVRDTDTAFSLNASCYEAGLDSFRELIANRQWRRPGRVAGMRAPGGLMRWRRWISGRTWPRWTGWFGRWILVAMPTLWRCPRSGPGKGFWPCPGWSGFQMAGGLRGRCWGPTAKA